MKIIIGFIVLIMMAATSFAGDCGDVNNGGNINILDIVYLIQYKYKGGPAPDPLKSAYANSDGVINIIDIVYLINYKYKAGPEHDLNNNESAGQSVREQTNEIDSDLCATNETFNCALFNH